MIRVLRRAAVLLLCALPACEKQPVAPQSGTLSVTLQNPNDGLDGAMLLTLSGPAAPMSVATVAGDTLWGGPFSGSSNKITLTGGVRNGVVVTFTVPDVSKAAQYTATVNQVAASSNYVLRPLSGYALTVTP